MLTQENICIRLKAYDHHVLDRSSGKIVEALNRVGALVKGPIPLPRSIRRVTGLRSPHIFKKSREHFEKRICARAVYVSGLTPQAMETLMSLDLPAGVSIEVRS